MQDIVNFFREDAERSEKLLKIQKNRKSRVSAYVGGEERFIKMEGELTELLTQYRIDDSPSIAEDVFDYLLDGIMMLKVRDLQNLQRLRTEDHFCHRDI